MFYMRGRGAGIDVSVVANGDNIVVRAICQGWRIQGSVKFQVLISVWGNLVRGFAS